MPQVCTTGSILCLKFLSHGKHAAAVMTSIPSSKHFRLKEDGTKEWEKRPLTREQVGDNIPEIEDLLERYAESKEFLSEIVSFFRRTGEWDRDDTIREYRREHCEKLVKYYADNGDFYHMLSNFREVTMDSEVASPSHQCTSNTERISMTSERTKLVCRKCGRTSHGKRRLLLSDLA